MFSLSYKKQESDEAKTVEDKAAYDFLMALYPIDFLARFALIEFYELHKA
jgi:hypothetical protein